MYKNTYHIAVIVVILGVCFETGCQNARNGQEPRVSNSATPAPDTQYAETSKMKPAKDKVKSMSTPKVIIKTTMGNIALELYPDKAPITVANFLKYVEDDFYKDTIFHRVIPGFMIQGGGLTVDMQKKPTSDPIKNEADNGLPNVRGTIAMARLPMPDSATSQFFINVKDNKNLDYQSPANPGYAVFGKVIEGMDVVDEIVGVPTTTTPPHRDVPVEPISIESVSVMSDK